MLGLGRILRVNNKKLTFTAGVVLAAVGVLSVSTLGVRQASAETCTDNDIIKCGFSTVSEFISDVRANNNKVNSTKDLQAIYAHYGLTAADYDNFVAHAVPGEAMSNGDVKLDTGEIVATGGMGLGRQHFSSTDQTVTIPGAGTYYSGTNASRFAAGVTEIPVYVLLNSQGQYVFSVMKACGNPEIATPKPTNASCNVLNKTPVAGKLNTYNFTASAVSQGNAKITKFVYNFGDGSPTVTQTSGSTVVSHAYTKTGTFTATVTVFASVPGNSNLQLPAVSLCARTVVVAAYECVQLNGATLDQKNMSFTFTATAKFSAGASFTSADFDFGDGHTQTGVKPAANGTTVTVSHTYATPNTYNANAVLHFMVNGQDVTAAGCPAVVTPTTPPTPECKPGVPEGSPECIPSCQPGSTVPPESPQCTPPELPSTGAGNTIAIFAAVAIGGFLIYRQLLFRKHKAAFVAAQMGTSALPLADPLNQENPLAGTPYATNKHRSLRRKRQF